MSCQITGFWRHLETWKEIKEKKGGVIVFRLSTRILFHKQIWEKKMWWEMAAFHRCWMPRCSLPQLFKFNYLKLIFNPFANILWFMGKFSIYCLIPLPTYSLYAFETTNFHKEQTVSAQVILLLLSLTTDRKNNISVISFLEGRIMVWEWYSPI